VTADFDFKAGRQTGDSLIDFDHDNALIVKFPEAGNQMVTLRNVITFPGLTNSHDHLEFNLFPFLANKIYDDYRSWGADIHAQNKTRIDEVLSIPLALRIKWGILKNIICGITAVVHHGGHHDLIKTFPYPVFLNYQYLHALDTEPFWKVKLNLVLRNKVLMIHTGEGTNQRSHNEITRLIHWNLFNRKVIGIHAIQMDEHQCKNFTAIVWCPDSNIKLYGKTAAVDTLKLHTTILFGTDSSVSASSSIWDQLRCAHALNLLSDEEIFESLTALPSKVFPEINQKGNLVVAKKKADHVWDSFFKINPEDLLIVAIENKIVLIDQSITDFPLVDYIPIRVGKSVKLIQKFWGSVIQELEEKRVLLPLDVSTI